MDAWSKASGAGEGIEFLADGNGDFAKAIGLTMDGAGFGLGTRSQRYAMVVDDGVVTALNVEDAPSKADVSGAENLLKGSEARSLSRPGLSPAAPAPPAARAWRPSGSGRPGRAPFAACGWNGFMAATASSVDAVVERVVRVAADPVPLTSWRAPPPPRGPATARRS